MLVLTIGIAHFYKENRVKNCRLNVEMFTDTWYNHFIP